MGLKANHGPQIFQKWILFLPRRPQGSLGPGLVRFPNPQPREKDLSCRVGGGACGVPYVKLGRRDGHHDGWACRLCGVLHCGPALAGVTRQLNTNHRCSISLAWRFSGRWFALISR